MVELVWCDREPVRRSAQSGDIHVETFGHGGRKITVMRILAGISLVVLLFSVGWRPQLWDVGWQGRNRTLAIDAIQRICAEIITPGRACASTKTTSPQFRSQVREAWMKQSEDLRDTFGAWQSVDVSGAEGGAPQEIMVQGSGAFGKGNKGKGNKTLYVGWHLEKGRAELLWLIVLLDPPMFRSVDHPT